MKQGWEIKKLGEVCTFCSGYTPKGNELNNEGLIPYFKVSDMNHRENIKYLTHTTLFLERGCKVYPKHTIVFPKNGAAIATNKKRILQEDSVIDLNTAGVIADKSIVYHEYLYLYLLGLDFRQYTRGGAVPTLDIAELKNKQIPVPSLVEQERIVAELDCLSGVIEKKKQQLKELEALAQSIFYEMFGDPITNEKGWEVKKINEVCKIFGRIGFRGYTTNDLVDSSSDGAISLSPTNIHNGQLTFSKCTYITWFKYEESPEIMIYEGDILLVKTGSSYGKCALVRKLPHEATINPQFVVLKNCDINNVFLTCLLQTPSAKREFDSFTIGAAIPTFSQKNLGNMMIVVPPLSLQQTFASKIEAIEKQKELIKQSIKEVETLFNSRMDYYFN